MTDEAFMEAKRVPIRELIKTLSPKSGTPPPFVQEAYKALSREQQHDVVRYLRYKIRHAQKMNKQEQNVADILDV